MKRFACLILSVLIICGCLCGCADDTVILSEQKEELQSQVNELSKEKKLLESTVIKKKTDLGIEKYIVEFEIKQTHITFDISEHIKDSLNNLELQVVVDKEYYDSVTVGEEVASELRVGSALMKGSFGSWKVRIKDKWIE